MNLLEELAELFKGHESAYGFLKILVRFLHAADDTVDEGFKAEKFCETLYLASLTFSSQYYREHYIELGSCFHTALNTWATTIEWERSGEEKKRNAANILRHCGFEMILKVVLMEHDWEKQREIDKLLRERVLNS